MKFRADVFDKIKKSLQPFINFSYRPLKKEVGEVIAKTGIRLSPPEFKFTYYKVKTAVNNFLPK